MSIKDINQETEKEYTISSDIPQDEFEWIGQDVNALGEMKRPSVSFWRDAWFRLKKDKIAMIFLGILVFIVLGAILVPMFSPYDISSMDVTHTNMGLMSKIDGALHLFGTDDLGRDMFVRVWYGGRISMIIAFSAVFINVIVGIVYGGISGYFGGKIDNVMMRIVEIIGGIPYLLIVILLMVVMKPGIATMIIAYSTVGWTGMARLVRGQVIQLKEQEYIIASQTMGGSSARIIAKHLIPNLLPIVIVNLTLSIPSAIFTEAFLSFIGLGVPVPEASWGTLCNDGIVVFQNYPLQLIIPGLFISITMLSFNLLGDSLRDCLDPKLRR